MAQEKADAIVSRAHAQADLLVAEAQASAEATTKAAEQRVRALDADTDAVWRDRARLIDDTRKLADGLLAVADDAAERFRPKPTSPSKPPARCRPAPPARRRLTAGARARAPSHPPSDPPPAVSRAFEPGPAKRQGRRYLSSDWRVYARLPVG